MKRVYSSVLSRTMLVADPATRSLVSRILATSTYAVGGFVALGTCGVDTSPIIAAMGISGATIGFACKDVGANMVAGLNLAASRPFEHGRTISVGAFKGIVDHWDTRYLYLRGPKGELIHVPNAVVFTSVITVHDPPATAFARDKHGDVVDTHEAAERIKHAVRHAAEEVRGGGASATVTAADEPAATETLDQAELAAKGDAGVQAARIIGWVFFTLLFVGFGFLLAAATTLDTVLNDQNSIFAVADKVERKAATLWQRTLAAVKGVQP